MTDKIVIRDKAPALFFNLIAAVGIMVLITMIYLAFATTDFTQDNGWRGFASWITVAIIVGTTAVKPVVTQQLQIDLTKNTYQKGYRLGPLSIGKWKILPRPDYISIFRQPLKNGKFNFEMNLWYDKIRHIELFYFDDPEQGFKTAQQVATVLKTNLVDARIPNETVEIPFDK